MFPSDQDHTGIEKKCLLFLTDQRSELQNPKKSQLFFSDKDHIRKWKKLSTLFDWSKTRNSKTKKKNLNCFTVHVIKIIPGCEKIVNSFWLIRDQNFQNPKKISTVFQWSRSYWELKKIVNSFWLIRDQNLQNQKKNPQLFSSDQDHTGKWKKIVNSFRLIKDQNFQNKQD